MSSDTLKRYQDYDDGFDNFEMREVLDGEWVRYEDYAALERELTALRKERKWKEPPCDYSVNQWYTLGFFAGREAAKKLNAPDTQATTGGEG